GVGEVTAGIRVQNQLPRVEVGDNGSLIRQGHQIVADPPYSRDRVVHVGQAFGARGPDDAVCYIEHERHRAAACEHDVAADLQLGGVAARVERDVARVVDRARAGPAV